MLPNDIFILGGGFSVRAEGALDNGLFEFLQDKFVIGINFTYKYVETTCNLGVDETLYEGPLHSELAALPMWIGKDCVEVKRREKNSIFLKASNLYDRDLVGGVYKSSLSGIFALSLAIKLSDFCRKNPKIHLLGYDYGPFIQEGRIIRDNFRSETFPNGRPLTHWYQENFTHRGTGKINWYCQTTLDYETRKRREYADVEFAPFKDESKVKIFNVGNNSMIPHFEKISYETFFARKFDAVNKQDNLRKECGERLQCIKHGNQI